MRIYKYLVILLCFFAISASADDVIKGTLISVSDTGYIRVDVNEEEYVITPSKGAKIMRAQVGKELKDVDIQHFAPGDTVVALIAEDGHAVSLKAYFAIITGIFAKFENNEPYFEDGRKIALAKDVTFIFPSGIGKLTDLQKGMGLTCRINPNSNEAWSVISDRDKKNEAKHQAKALDINAVIVTVGENIMPGDKINVKITGTPKSKAYFEIDNLIGQTPLIETSLGVYEGAVTVPNKTVTNAPVIGKISDGKTATKPLQARKLITVAAKNTPAPEAIAQKTSESKPQQVTPPVAEQKPAAEPIPESVPEPLPSVPMPAQEKYARITIETPADATNIGRRLRIAGTAQPDSNIWVNITYTNGLSGMLKLAGEMINRSFAVDKNGNYNIGPIDLEDLYSSGLIFTMKVYYPDQTDKQTAALRFVANK